MRAGDCTVDASFLEEALFSKGFFPFVGDLRLISEVEDFERPTWSRLRLRELAALEDSFGSDLVSDLVSAE